MKLSAIILSFTILFQSFNFEISDFNKIPNFIDDIKCHVNAGESFSDFIADHYNILSNGHDHSGNTCKHDAHGELPFKHQHIDTHSQVVFIILANDFFTDYQESFLKNKKYSYKEPTSNLFINKFFQPPRV